MSELKAGAKSNNLLTKPSQYLVAAKSQEDGMTSFKSEEISSEYMLSSKLDDSHIQLFNPDGEQPIQNQQRAQFNLSAMNPETIRNKFGMLKVNKKIGILVNQVVGKMGGGLGGIQTIPFNHQQEGTIPIPSADRKYLFKGSGAGAQTPNQQLNRVNSKQSDFDSSAQAAQSQTRLQPRPLLYRRDSHTKSPLPKQNSFRNKGGSQKNQQILLSPQQQQEDDKKIPLRLRKVNLEGIYSTAQRKEDEDKIRQFFEINPKMLKFADGMKLINRFVYDSNSIYQQQKLSKLNQNSKLQNVLDISYRQTNKLNEMLKLFSPMNSFHNRSRYGSQPASVQYYQDETEDPPQYEQSPIDQSLLTLDIRESSNSPSAKKKLLAKFIYSEKKQTFHLSKALAEEREKARIQSALLKQRRKSAIKRLNEARGMMLSNEGLKQRVEYSTQVDEVISNLKQLQESRDTNLKSLEDYNQSPGDASQMSRQNTINKSYPNKNVFDLKVFRENLSYYDEFINNAKLNQERGIRNRFPLYEPAQTTQNTFRHKMVVSVPSSPQSAAVTNRLMESFNQMKEGRDKSQFEKEANTTAARTTYFKFGSTARESHTHGPKSNIFSNNFGRFSVQSNRDAINYNLLYSSKPKKLEVTNMSQTGSKFRLKKLQDYKRFSDQGPLSDKDSDIPSMMQD
ncbi:UNKNOWN [Stylonychia lemnae]|uniref:Uncharacterized protein n=1 Tax=Stylonychia lemnae TaxID=5949 RepID=A0A077ZSW7_STYLE|nr:UNKNOWN [Stylonychia lemnae]|eukprot:CDW72978.1 UNKNOWN [Stylonychia lemnae]